MIFDFFFYFEETTIVTVSRSPLVNIKNRKTTQFVVKYYWMRPLLDEAQTDDNLFKSITDRLN